MMLSQEQHAARFAYVAKYPHLNSIRDWRTFCLNASRLSCAGIPVRHLLVITRD